MLLVLLVSGPASAATSPPTGGGSTVAGAAAWAAVAAVTVLTGMLVLFGLRHGGRSRWGYPVEVEGEPGRDLRVDLLRGLAIVFVVLNHVTLTSLYQLLSQETIGMVSGAELFVVMSGVVLGMVYRTRAAVSGLAGSTFALWARARLLYVTSLVVVLTVYLLTLLPGVDGRAVTTFTVDGTTYDIYPNIERFADYPVPGYAFRQLLLLEMGPWQFNVMGLYVVLLLVTPVLLWALTRRAWLAMVVLSWVLYALNAWQPTRLLPSQFEDSFPLLTWQVLFVHGLVLGYHRRRILSWAGTAWGRLVVGGLVMAWLGFAVLAWNDPYLANGYDVRLGLVDGDSFEALYAAYFERTGLGLGRLANVLLVLLAGYALLTVFWRPVHRAVGWFLVPLGKATLYVFVIHVFLALLVAEIPGLGATTVLVNTVVHTLVLALLWVMVRKRVLFRLVPR